ncbi:hypothetical protein [Methylobacterium sp. MA0201]|uniref:hypothetical protein n=1 Tax=Methylobacterium alsaeris TaxID=3344826 RepID=UPI003756D2EF
MAYELIVDVIPVLPGLYGEDLDALLPLELACHAPELQDAAGDCMFSPYQLRRAVKTGALRGFRPGHGILTTRRAIREWKDAWHAPANRPASSSTSTEGSGRSTTASTSDAQRMALAIAQRLKRSSRAT